MITFIETRKGNVLISYLRKDFNTYFLFFLVGQNIAPGGVFPAPPAVADLLLQLPPPTSFRVRLV